MAILKHLLIVDDQTAIVQLLEEFLLDEGFEVESITDSAAALRRLREDPVPDLAILDIMMPQVTGWEILDAVRGDARTATVPIILLTAAPRQAQIDFKERNPSNCILLAKPIGLDELLDRIHTMLDQTPHGPNSGSASDTPPSRAGASPAENGLNLHHRFQSLLGAWHEALLTAFMNLFPRFRPFVSLQ